MIYRRAFVIGKLNNVRIFIERALSVYDDYVRIVNGEYEFPDEFGQEPNNTKLDGQDDFDILDPEDILFGEYERALDVLRAYQEWVARAALNEINSIIEYELKLLASTTLSKQSGKPLRESWQRNREKAVKIIEDNYAIKLSELDGFKEVEKVRKTINAYKHDEGYGENEYGRYASIADIYAEIQKNMN